MRLRIKLEDQSYDVTVEVLPEAEAASPLDDPLVSIPESVLRPPHLPDTTPEDKICRSPIAGLVIAVAALPHQRLLQDDPVATIEAMKMQTIIGAPLDGEVEEVLVKPGQAVQSGQILCTLS